MSAEKLKRHYFLQTRLFRSKKGLELSMTIIVTIIISVIIFIGGITMVWKFFSSTTEIQGAIDQNTKNQIESLLRDSNDLVAIPINSKQVRPGKEATFGLGIRNIQETQAFYIRMDFAGIYDTKGQEIEGVEPNPEYVEAQWLGNFQEQEVTSIEKNKFVITPLRVRAASMISDTQQTPRDSMIVFNVCVFAGNPGGECELSNKMGVYDKIRQVIVEVK